MARFHLAQIQSRHRMKLAKNFNGFKTITVWFAEKEKGVEEGFPENRWFR
jgi:hypothetical protein